MLDTLFYRPQGLFDQLETLHRVLSRSIGADGAPDGIRSVAAGSFPPINVGRTANSVEVYAFVPGLDAATIDLTIERGILKISGERVSAMPKADRAVQVYASERTQGRFSRALTLPDDIDTAKVSAKYSDGVLLISIGLQEAAQPQRIAVQ